MSVLSTFQVWASVIVTHVALQITPEDDAALTVLAAITEWFTVGESEGIFDALKTKSPGNIIEFLFGSWVASIETICEMMDCEPADYIQQVSLQLQQTMVMESST
jgi:hypothetical protein